jgi:hypothetical protein
MTGIIGQGLRAAAPQACMSLRRQGLQQVEVHHARLALAVQLQADLRQLVVAQVRGASR